MCGCVQTHTYMSSSAHPKINKQTQSSHTIVEKRNDDAGNGLLEDCLKQILSVCMCLCACVCVVC